MVGLNSEPGSAGSRQLIERIGELARGDSLRAGQASSGRPAPTGLRGVHIDATRSGLRARDLDRSGRRDLAAMLRRLELACSGVDVFVPGEHLVHKDTADRAVASVVGAIELAADLRSLGAGAGEMVVCVALPREIGADVLSAIQSASERSGVRVADCAWPMREGAEALGEVGIGVGIDPAAVLSAGEAPERVAARAGSRLVLARVSDIRRGLVGVRCMPGSREGSLDVEAYATTLSVIGYRGMAVLDVRGVNGATAALPHTVERWNTPV